MESGSVDVESSHRFYGGLFDWVVDEKAFASGGSYTRFLMQDLPVAGVFSVEADQDLSALPAQWWPFVSVANVKTALNQAVALGAVPFGDVVEVPGVFSAAEFLDPAGTICGLWQAGTHIGANYIDEAGALTWTDLATPDPSAAASFYGELFGWTVESENDLKSGTYKFFTSDGAVRAGLTRSDSAASPSWRPHVGVSNFDATTAAANNLGGVVGVEASNVVGLGRRAAVEDPNGISLMLIETKP
jgi:predicted enzyme related to lactoylglutathione lyase